MSSNISSSNMNFYSNIYAENKVFAIIKVRNKKKWTKEEDLKLIKLAERNKEKHWKEISKNFLNKNPLQCFSRYKRIKPGIIKGTWTKEEDDRILSLVGIYGKSWSKLAKIMKSRNGKQIRDRFINVLDPDVKKGKFTYKEDRKIKKLYLKYGPRWATIARGLPNRTPDMIKNRFHSSIKKYLHQRNFLSKSENMSRIPNRESECNSKECGAPLNHTNSVSDLIISNSKSLVEKNFLNNFSNFSSSNQEVNLEQNIFQYRLNQMFYNDNRHNFDSYSSNKIRENNIYINENENNCNPFDKILSLENFTYNVKNENKSLGKKKSNLSSKLKEADLSNDSERTVSNSEYSLREKDKSNQCSKFGNKNNNNYKNEINENFEYPVEQIHLENYICNSSKIESNGTQNNLKNQSYSNNQNNYQINSLKDNIVLSNFESRGVINNNNLNGSTFPNKNLNNFFEKENKTCHNDKANHKKISKENETQKAQIANSNKNKLLNDEIIKNEQEFEKPKSNKVSEIKISAEERIISDFFLIESHLYNNTQNNNDYESHANKNNFFNCNENSRSTNLVTCQNISSYSSNSYTIDENDQSSNDNIKNNNGNSDIISGLDDNYHMNFMNFADSPFRMNSPKYYDFQDFFNSN